MLACPADVDTPPPAAADDADDEEVGVVDNEMRSVETAGVGRAAGRELVTAAGSDEVLPELTGVCDREPADNDVVVVANEGEAMSADSKSMFDETFPRAEDDV